MSNEMIQQKVPNRWKVVVGALLIQLCLGAIYAWGAFTGALQDPEGIFKFSATQTSWIFSAGLASFALTMIMAGRWQDKYGPRIIALIGGIVLGAGYIIASQTGPDFTLMLVFIGIVGGAGIGLGYVCPIAACMKWFPDMKGFITGLAVAGFGAGAFIFIKLAGGWGNFLAEQGVNGTFLIFGIIFLVCVVAGALLLSNPPA
ncbi:MAG: MFS transporter, partial [Sedimentisphaerales bacterium]|nr:MFS transporter [Sedimentisphaerales bacterium]